MLYLGKSEYFAIVKWGWKAWVERMRNETPIQNQIISLEGHAKEFKLLSCQKQEPLTFEQKEYSTPICVYRKITLAAVFRMNWRTERQRTVRNRWETTSSHINLRWWLLWREDTFRWHSGRMERTWCLIQCGEGRSKAFQLRQLVNYGIINRRGNVKGLRKHNFVWCMWSSKCSQPNHIEKLRKSLEVGISSLKTRGRRFRLDLINYGYLETKSITVDETA